LLLGELMPGFGGIDTDWHWSATLCAEKRSERQSACHVWIALRSHAERAFDARQTKQRPRALRFRGPCPLFGGAKFTPRIFLGTKMRSVKIEDA